MKFYETHYEDYLTREAETSLHPKLDNIYKTFPDNIKDFKNLIFYGPKGVGKYTQMLKSIKKYSPSELKYDRKIQYQHNSKSTYILKISDIHFEVDMSLLGCNSKALWNEIYNHIIDVVLARENHTGIIVCKYFHEIHSELLECFYSYMQTLHHNSLDIKFIILTEELSFIPDSIISRSRVIRIPRPSRTQYNKCLKNSVGKDINLNEITNMKNINASVRQLMRPYEVICDEIIEYIVDVEKLKFMDMRDRLYDLLIYSLDITDCFWYILEKLISLGSNPNDSMPNIILHTYRCLQYFNNNYRPIYHLENWIFYLIVNVNGLAKGM